MNYGFVKVATAIPSVKVADCPYNTQHLLSHIEDATRQGVEILIFPELSITAYTCADLFAQQLLLQESYDALQTLQHASLDKDLIFIVGMPLEVGPSLFNCAVAIQSGRILGVVPKIYLPNYKEFYEMRWFASGADQNKTISIGGQNNIPFSPYLIFETPSCRFGIEICEDLWAPIPPSSQLALEGADIIFNMSADNESTGKHAYLRSLISQQSARCIAGYVFSSCGFGESTTDIVFAGNGLIYENGALLAESKRFSFGPQMVVSEIDVERIRTERRVNTTFTACQKVYHNDCYRYIQTKEVQTPACELTRYIEAHPFIPKGRELDDRCEEIFAIQTAGLAKRLVHTHCQTVVIGISGGLDSTLALLVAVRTFDKLGLARKGIIGITMPGFGTTDRTYHNAISLMQSLQVSIREISIRNACIQHFQDIGHDINKHDVTYENGQARERTQILMDIANQTNGLVIGTGDLSELALGWATYNGDHMSMYAVNTSIPKTLVKHLVAWVAENNVDTTSRDTLFDIIETPISPELIPADDQGNIKQKTEDLVGPYELHDFFLYHFVRFGCRPSKIFYLAQKAFENTYDKPTIKKWLTTFCRRFFTQQFKRSCIPDGPKVGSVVLSPRGDWRMPSDASSTSWIKECEELPS